MPEPNLNADLTAPALSRPVRTSVIMSWTQIGAGAVIVCALVGTDPIAAQNLTGNGAPADFATINRQAAAGVLTETAVINQDGNHADMVTTVGVHPRGVPPGVVNSEAAPRGER